MRKTFLKLRDREKDLDLHLFLYDYKKIGQDISQVDRNAELIGRDLDQARNEYDQIKVKNNVISNKIDKLDEKMEHEQGSRDQLRESCDEKERESLVLKNQISANDQMGDHYKEIAVSEAARISEMARIESTSASSPFSSRESRARMLLNSSFDSRSKRE